MSHPSAIQSMSATYLAIHSELLVGNNADNGWLLGNKAGNGWQKGGNAGNVATGSYLGTMQSACSIL